MAEGKKSELTNKSSKDLPEYQEKIKLEIQPLDNKLEKLNQL
jgi:hypothetical protein